MSVLNCLFHVLFWEFHGFRCVFHGLKPVVSNAKESDLRVQSKAGSQAELPKQLSTVARVESRWFWFPVCFVEIV